MGQLLELKQKPIIDSAGIEGLSNMIDKRIKALNIDGQVATPETVKSLKTTRANLNKEFKEYDGQRKLIKSAILNPYNEFEEQFKTLIAEKYQHADKKLREKIYNVEDQLKKNRTGQLITYFTELCLDRDIDFLQFDDVNLNVTLSASYKSLKDKIDAYVDKISEELRLIEVLPEDEEFKAEVRAEYKRTKDATQSIKVIQERRADKEAELLQRNSTQTETVVKPAPAKVETKVAEPLQEPIKEESKEVATFTVRATLNQLIALKKYLEDNNIELI